MGHWHFMDYRTEDGRTLIQEWYDGVDSSIQAEFDVVLTFLAAREDWTGQWRFKDFTKKHVGLGEIRLREKKSGVPLWRYRPLGFFSLNYREFVLVLGCKKRFRLYYPRDACETALDLKKQFEEEGRGSIHEHAC
jgi:hypothetical protein